MLSTIDTYLRYCGASDRAAAHFTSDAANAGKVWRRFRIKVVGMIAAAMSFCAADSYGHASPAFNNPADVKALTALEIYLNLQVDMRPIIADYAPDAIIYDIPAPGVYHGTKQIYDGFEPQLARMQSNKLGIPDLNIVSDGTLACVAMQLHYNVTFKGGVTASYQYRDIDVFRKVDGKWVVVQSHLSFPVNAKTGATVMNGPIQTIGHIDWNADMIQAPAEDTGQAKADILNWMVVDANTIDVDQFARLYGPGDDVMIYDGLYPGDLRGIKGIENYYRPFFADVKTAKAVITQSYVDSDGLLGAVIDQQTLHLTAKDGSQKTISFRQSDCLHRVNGQWYSVIEMNSFPADLKSGKSLMNSPPAP